MSKWKCEICGKEFNNFHAQGFDGKIYCPLCYFKKENLELQHENQKYKEIIDKAIKYIEKNINQKLYTGEEIFDTYSPATDLLNILEMVE